MHSVAWGCARAEVHCAVLLSRSCVCGRGLRPPACSCWGWAGSWQSRAPAGATHLSSDSTAKGQTCGSGGVEQGNVFRKEEKARLLCGWGTCWLLLACGKHHRQLALTLCVQGLLRRAAQQWDWAWKCPVCSPPAHTVLSHQLLKSSSLVMLCAGRAVRELSDTWSAPASSLVAKTCVKIC